MEDRYRRVGRWVGGGAADGEADRSLRASRTVEGFGSGMEQRKISRGEGSVVLLADAAAAVVFCFCDKEAGDGKMRGKR